MTDEIKRRGKGRAFLIGLLVLNLAYLAAEAIFNSSLLDLVVQQSPSMADLEALELVGRSIAGAGAALLMLGLLAPRGIPAAWVASAVVITALLVYFLQKEGIDYYVEQTSADERANAQRMLYLKQGLIAGYVQIEELPNHLMEPGEPLIPASRTFLALIGWLAPTSPGFETLAESRLDDIVQRVLNEESSEQNEGAFQSFQGKAREIDRLYERYREADRQYALAKAGDPQAATDAWVGINEGVADGYDKWLAKREGFDERVASDAAELHPHLIDYFEDRGQCGNSKSCQSRYDARYQKHFAPRIGGDSKWQDWCDPVYGRKFWDAGGGADGLKFQFDPGTALVAGIEALIGKKKLRGFDCSNVDDATFVESRLHEKKLPEFESKSDYPYNTTRAEYLTSPLTSRRIADNLRNDGLNLPSGWTLDDRAAFINAYQAELQTNAGPTWNRETTAMVGQTLPHTLSRDDFFAHEAVQAKLSEVLGEQLYREGIRPDLDASEFKSTVTDPSLEEDAASIVELLTEDTERFADGNDKAAAGKDAVRTLVIPNVALLVSAFVVVLTLIKTFWLILSLLPLEPISRRLPKLIKITSKLGISLAVVIAIPASLSNPFTKSEGFTFFMQEAREASFPVWASSYYLMRLQPELAPIGTQLREWIEAADPTRDAASKKEEQPPDTEPKTTPAEVDDLIRQANMALNKDYLLTPRDRSAVHYYKQVLASDPGSEQAIAGLERVASRYRDLAERRDEAKAARYRERSETVEDIITKARQDAAPNETSTTADAPPPSALPMLPQANNPAVVLMWLTVTPIALWLMLSWPGAARGSSREATKDDAL